MRASSKQQTSLEQLPLEDSWKALRGRPLRRRVVEKILTAPPVEPVIKWTLRFHDDTKRPVMLVVPGDTTHTRMDWYRKYLGDEWASFRPNTVEDIVSQPSRDWVEQSVLLNFTERLAAAKIPRDGDHRDFDSPTGTWEFLWALGQTEGLTVNGPLREMVDQPHYLFHEVYLVFWSLRFRIKENDVLRIHVLPESTPCPWVIEDNLHHFKGGETLLFDLIPLACANGEGCIHIESDKEGVKYHKPTSWEKLLNDDPADNSV